LSAIQNAQQMLHLARSRDPADRQALLLAVVELCETAQKSGAGMDTAGEELVNSVFMALVADAEREIRRALSERLADAAWAPHDLILLLARDEIEIARPVIAQSPVLSDFDLVRLLAIATLDHQIEVARRPCIGPRVVDAILTLGQPAVLTALADNDTADISPMGMVRLVGASRDVAAMRSPLVRHPKLTNDMAEQLYVWVGQSLREAIVGRFRVDAQALDQAIAGAVHDVRNPAAQANTPVVPDKERREMEARLVVKLHAAQQLRPGYLLRALREQRLSLFNAALAKLAGVEIEHIELAIERDRPELLALACTAAGVDQGAFATILGLVRELADGKPQGGADAGRRAMKAFSTHDPDRAVAAFRQAVAVA
jgi:uncharacterized protein (DUF2336 family)